jgi:hypothetical protein
MWAENFSVKVIVKNKEHMYPPYIFSEVEKKGKAVPLQAWTGP